MYKNRKLISYFVLISLLVSSTAQLYAGFSSNHTSDYSAHSLAQVSTILKIDYANTAKESCIDHCESQATSSECINAAALYQFFSSKIHLFIPITKQTISNTIKLSVFERFSYSLFRPPIQLTNLS